MAVKEFEDGSYLEIKEVDDKDLVVSICARDPLNQSIVTVLSVKMEKIEFSTIAKNFVKFPKEIK